ncbi:hypothetical protein [Streptomyces griseoloalbus]
MKCPARCTSYWDLEDRTRADDPAMMPAVDQVRVVIHPETVHRHAY